MKSFKTALCISMLFLSSSLSLLGQIPNYEAKLIYEVTLKSGATVALDTIEELKDGFHSTTETHYGSITFVYPKSTVKSIEKKHVYIWNGPVPARKARPKYISSAPQSSSLPKLHQPDSTPERLPDNRPAYPICYVSESGSHYHSVNNCSIKVGGSLMRAIYSTSEMSKNLTLCGNCWEGDPLF